MILIYGIKIFSYKNIKRTAKKKRSKNKGHQNSDKKTPKAFFFYLQFIYFFLFHMFFNKKLEGIVFVRINKFAQI